MTSNKTQYRPWDELGQTEIEYFKACYLAERERSAKLIEAAVAFISETQNQSKGAGHNRMHAPKEYIALIEAVNVANREE